MKRAVIGLTLAGIAVAVGIGYSLRKPADQATYRLTPVERGTVLSTVSATGTLSAVSTVQVGTQVSGQVAQLYADFNDHVRRGQLIARIDSTLLVQAVRQADAEVVRARADNDQQQFLLAQATTLFASQGVTETELRTAQYNATVAGASLRSAQASLERAQLNLRYTAIHAPIDGIVIERNVDVGQTVAASLSAPQLFLIAEDLKRMQILVSVDESDIGQIRTDQTARFTVQAYPNRRFTGTVRQVRMQSKTSENVVNYTVVVAVTNTDNVLLPGMTATVDFEVAKAENVLTVANAALRFRAPDSLLASVRGAQVRTPDSLPAGARAPQSAANMVRLWYLDASGRPAMVPVQTGLSDGQKTQISGAGLAVGMRAIAGLASGSAAAPTTNPFQPQPANRQGGGGAPRPPGGM